MIGNEKAIKTSDKYFILFILKQEDLNKHLYYM
jgi:hypothetical protein